MTRAGAGKTRGFVKPSLMQMHSSYVVTDPKGTVVVEVGRMLQKGCYLFDDRLSESERKRFQEFPRDRQGRILSKKTVLICI